MKIKFRAYHQLDFRADRLLQQSLRRAEYAGNVDRPWIQMLPAVKGKQMPGQRGATLRRTERCL